MPSSACVRHAETAASFRCESCASLLCRECVEEGHALLFCRLCGERALPVGAAGSAPEGSSQAPAATPTLQEMRRQEARSKPYNLGQALLYPFRGLGLYLYIGAVVCLVFLTFLVRYGFGCYRFFLYLGFWSLMVGIQFRIIRSTAEGDDELPDWPDYGDFTERVLDILTYSAVTALAMVPAFGYTAIVGFENVFTTEPSLLFWGGFAVFAWAGVALFTMAFGAAGTFGGGLLALRVDLHYQAFRAGGADAVNLANVIYVLGIVMAAAPALLSVIPLVGPIFGAVLSAYWTLVGPHLIGVYFRRHADAMETIYS